MTKKMTSTPSAVNEKTEPVSITYVGPPDAESPRYGLLVPGRCYQESDPKFAAYLCTAHPDHWERG